MDERLEILSMDNFHDLTKNLWVERIPASISEGRHAMLVVGIKEGVFSGPYMEDVNTAAVVLHRLGTLEEGEYKGSPVVSGQPKDVSSFILGALRGAEQEGERGLENTAVFWLVRLTRSGKPDASSVRRWTYRDIGTPQARISYDARDIPTRSLREAIKEHAVRLRQYS